MLFFNFLPSVIDLRKKKQGCKHKFKLSNKFDNFMIISKSNFPPFLVDFALTN